MEWIDVAALIVSLVALGISFVTSQKANDLAKGQVEMQIREMITNAKNNYADKCLTCKDREQDSVSEAVINTALENTLNAYDEACAKYIDGKVDKNRFKKMYMHEIRQLVEDKATKEKYAYPSSRYQATLKVYNKWNNLES